MGTIHIEVEGLKALQKKLAKLGDEETYKQGMLAGGEEIRDKVSPYPPESEANVPGGPGSRWYKRGFGSQYMRVTDGVVTGKRTSQTLGRKWYARLKGSGVEVGNQSDYAEYVQGERQARFHGPRGWKKLLDVTVETIPDIVRKLSDQINRMWGQ